MPSLPTPTTDRMPCMEVWGGNSLVDRRLAAPGLRVWVNSQPYRSASGGGDVYYVSSCASGRITRLLLADVSGHGQAVAQVSAGLRELMRRNVNLIKQGHFVREMNQQFADLSNVDEFATAIVCTFFSPTRSLQFCNAGHPIPLLYQRRNRTWAPATEVADVRQATGIVDTPLGAIEGAEYTRFEVKLEPGDMVLCVSDAFTESLSSAGDLLGTSGLLRIVRQLDVDRPDDFNQQLTGAVRREHANNLEQDDATALLFQSDGSSPSLASDLLVPIRLLRGVRDAPESAIDPDVCPVPDSG